MPECQRPPLLVAKIHDCGGIRRSRHALEVTFQETAAQAQSLFAVRLVEQSAKTLAEHKQGVIAGDIIGKPVLHPIVPRTIRSASWTAMNQLNVGEG